MSGEFLQENSITQNQAAYSYQIARDTERVSDFISNPPDVIFMTTYGISEVERSDGTSEPINNTLQIISILSIIELIKEVRLHQAPDTPLYRPVVFLSSGHPISKTDIRKEEQIIQELLNSMGVCECVTPTCLGAHSAWDTRSEIICFKNFFRGVTSANRTLTITSAPHMNSVVRMMARVGITNFDADTDMQVISSEGLLNYFVENRLLRVLEKESPTGEITTELKNLERSEVLKGKFLDLLSAFNDKSGFTLSALAFALQLFKVNELALRTARRIRR